jgi:hypothetical protein
MGNGQVIDVWKGYRRVGLIRQIPELQRQGKIDILVLLLRHVAAKTEYRSSDLLYILQSCFFRIGGMLVVSSRGNEDCVAWKVTLSLAAKGAKMCV